MASPAPLLRPQPLHRLRLFHQHPHHFLLENNCPITHRSLCTATSDSNFSPITSPSPSLAHLFPSPTTHQDSGDTDSPEWKIVEAEILREIEPLVSLVKYVLHSGKYMDGEFLTLRDEQVVVEKLLAHHPHSSDKIGCGLEAIMVDRHPQFQTSRCLFVVRTDGVWIDFSYQKCLRAYIRSKYPYYAEKFLRKHLKRGSGTNYG